MDVSFLGGPQPQRGVGVVAPFDFALDRELWRWVPDEVSLHLTRTPFVPVEVSLGLARLVSEHETLQQATQALCAVNPEVVAYACSSGSFVGGIAGERAMCTAMEQSGEVPALTTSGALLDALHEIGAERIALVTPYTWSVTQSLEDYLAEGGIAVTGRAFLGLTRHIWKVPYRDVVDMARQAVVGRADALFISCTNLATYDAIPQLEAELRMPVLSANQVTMWAALRRIGERAVGPYQALLDPVARRGPAAMSSGNAEPPPADTPGVPLPPAPADPMDALGPGAGEPADPAGRQPVRFGDALPVGEALPLGDPGGRFGEPGGPGDAGPGPGALGDTVPLGDPGPLGDAVPLGDPGPLGESVSFGDPGPGPLDESVSFGNPGPLGEPGPLGHRIPLGEGRGEPEAAFAGSASGLPGAESEAADGMDAPPYPDDPAGPAPL